MPPLSWAVTVDESYMIVLQKRKEKCFKQCKIILPSYELIMFSIEYKTQVCIFLLVQMVMTNTSLIAVCSVQYSVWRVAQIAIKNCFGGGFYCFVLLLFLFWGVGVCFWWCFWTIKCLKKFLSVPYCID